MNNKFHQYTAIITKSYPRDIRIFISRIIPTLVDFYDLSTVFDKETELNRFEWGNMYHRKEYYLFGENSSPSIGLTREVLGDKEYTDEWETSTFELIDFCPPNMNDTLYLKIECAESFLTTDKGTHQCKIDFKSDSLSIYTVLMAAIDNVLSQYKNAVIETIEN